MTDNTAKIEKSLEDSVRLKMSLSVYIKFGTYIIREQVSLFIKYAVFLVFMASLTPIFTYIWKRYMDLASEGTDVIFSCDIRTDQGPVGSVLFFFYEFHGHY